MTLDARKFTLLQDMTRQLNSYMSSEAIEILARATAEVMSRDPAQFSHLATSFKHTLNKELAYIASRSGSSAA